MNYKRGDLSTKMLKILLTSNGNHCILNEKDYHY